MAEDDESSRNKREWKRARGGCGPGGAGAVYGLGFIGAVVYYLQQATTFWLGILGILKAIVWPAFLVYHLLQFLKM